MDNLIAYPVALVLFVATFFNFGGRFKLFLLPAACLLTLVYIVWSMEPAFVFNVFSILSIFLMFLFTLGIERKSIYILATISIIVAPTMLFFNFGTLAGYFIGAFFFFLIAGTTKDLYETE